eukprot:gene28650-35544_t
MESLKIPAFVFVAFPGLFVGVITRVSQSGVGISEKVWVVSGGDPPPGNYEGEADVVVLRDLLQHSKNKADAEAYIQSVKRTWGQRQTKRSAA